MKIKGLTFEKVLAVLDFVTYWSIVAMPFAVALSQGTANVCIGLFSISYLAKKALLREFPKMEKALAIPLLCLLAATLLSMTNTVSISASIRGITKLLNYFLLFFAVSESIRDRGHVAKIVVSACCGLGLILMDIAWQLNTGRDFIRHQAMQVGMLDLARPTASFFGPNALAIYMTALMPLVAGLGLFYCKGARKWIMLAFGGAVFLCILTTLSRGAVLGAYVAILILSIIKKEKWLMLLLFGVVLMVPFFMPVNAKQWAKEAHYNPAVILFNQDRLSIYQNTVHMIRHHPLVGVGVNTFSSNYSRYKLENVEKQAATKDTWYGHNNYLHMAGEIGLLGLASFFWFLFQAFKLSIRNYRKLDDPYLKAVALALIACLAGFLINGLTESSLYYPKIAMVFWFLLGLSISFKKFQPQAH